MMTNKGYYGSCDTLDMGEAANGKVVVREELNREVRTLGKGEKN